MLLAAAPIAGYRTAAEHLLDELRWLDLLLARHVAALKASGQFNEDPLRGLYITDAEVAASLRPAAACDGEYDGRIAARRVAIDSAVDAAEVCLPLPSIATRLGLDRFAAASLLVAAAPGLDRRYETLFAYAQNDVARKQPTVALILSLLLSDPLTRLGRLKDFSGSAPLLRTRLLRTMDPDRPLMSRGVFVDDRVLFALLGEVSGSDERLAPLLRVIEQSAIGVGECEAIDKCVAGAHDSRASLVFLQGPLDSGQRQLAYNVCKKVGRKLIEADLCHPAATSLSADELGGLIAREALLNEAGILLVTPTALPEPRLEQIVLATACIPAPVFLAAGTSRIPHSLLHTGVVSTEIELPAGKPALREQWWKAALQSRGIKHERALPARLGNALRLGPNRIEDVARSVDAPADIMKAARLRSASEVPPLAQLVRPHWSWDDLVLAARQREQLRQICATLEHSPRVMQEWGFEAKMPAGRNTVVLFSGPSGTGKTMCASLIAASAGQTLYACKIPSIFDKYVGETEKNLERLFNEAETANAVLFFDEADVLFGARSEQKDGHDRMGNLCVAYLLQRVETFEGLVILASNLASNMDEAFARRFSHVVLFSLPDAGLRRELWSRAWPLQAPLASDLDLDAIACNFDLSGGNIRNAAVAAAYLAAADNGPIAQRHLLRAIACEIEKSGRRPISADFRSFPGEAGLVLGA